MLWATVAAVATLVPPRCGFQFSDQVHHQWEVEDLGSRSRDESSRDEVDPSSSMDLGNIDWPSEHQENTEHNEVWTLPSFLLDEVCEQEWHAQGLPGGLSTSAALALKVPLPPVCLDPHEQADVRKGGMAGVMNEGLEGNRLRKESEGFSQSRLRGGCGRRCRP